MSYTQKFTDEPEQTLVAVPATATPATWNDLRVSCTEQYNGKYSVTVDKTVSTEWWIYIGTSVPTDWNDRILEFSVPTTSGPTIVLPTGFLKSINRNTNNALDLYIGESGNYTTALEDNKGRPVSLASGTWKIVVKSPVGAEEAYSFQANLTVSGDDDNVVTFALGTLCDELRPDHEFSIRETTSDLVKLKGVCNVRYAP